MLSKRIVLADDAELRRALEDSFFQRAGFALLPARDAAAALALIEEWGPDLAILEGETSGGEALCRRLKGDALLRSTRLLLVVSAEAKEAAARCRAAGCDSVLFRPLEESGLHVEACRLLGMVCRAVTRMPVDLPLRYRPEAGDAATGRALNLNGGGIFVAADRLYPVGTVVSLEIDLPASSPPLRADARVTWVNHPEWVKRPLLPPGMGLQFIRFAEGAEVRFRALLEGSP